MKDHEIRELVNTLVTVAATYHGAQQLRERICHEVVPALTKLNDENVRLTEEIAKLKRGEFICLKYGLRKDSDFTNKWDF